MEIMVLMTSVRSTLSQPEHQGVLETDKHNLLHMKPRNTLFNSGFMNWNTVHVFVSPQPIHPSTAMRIVSYVVAA